MQQPQHKALFYDSDTERLEYLCDYFGSGIRNKELCIWVTDLGQNEAVESLRESGLPLAARYVEQNQLRIFGALESYLQNGKFTSAYMMANVYSFLDDAHSDGYSGLRTAGEMNWLEHHHEAHSEAGRYEKDVNTITGAMPFTGLCLYAIDRTTDEVVQNTLVSHPQVVRKGKTLTNPLFLAA